jgi:hypothetical protein
MKKEIPILFSSTMVQAIIAGRKTMTRRIVKPQPIDNTEVDGNFFHGNHKGYVKVDGHPNWQKQFAHEFANWKVGDILWVREAFSPVKANNFNGGKSTLFKADVAENKFDGYKWKPSIHMPKEAARIWLEVTEVRVERLHDITEEDAIAEGVEKLNNWWKDYTSDQDAYDMQTAMCSFDSLWKKINGEESWNENPWVWVVSFKVLSTTGKP